MTLELLGFCPLGSCEMASVRLSGGAKERLCLLRSHTSPESVTLFWLQLCQDPLSGTKQPTESSSDAVAVENLIWETQTGWELHSYRWWMSSSFHMQGTLTFRCWWCPSGKCFSFTISVQQGRKQEVVSNNYTFSMRKNLVSLWGWSSDSYWG